MSGNKFKTDESGWTKAQLQKLLAAMKSCIPEQDRMSAYTKGLKAVDWSQVAFSPFSPEACQEKWREILQKMRKMRTLTELIVEAEDVVSNPVQNIKIHPELPKRPNPPNAIFYEENFARFHEQHPKQSSQKLFKNLNKKYKKLPDEEKAQYVEKYQLAIEDYKRRMLEFRKQYHKPPNCESRTTPKRKRVSADTPDVADGLPPKPPFNGYNLFCKEQLASMAGVSRGLYVSVWTQRWHDLSETQRDEYNTRCRELKRKYSIKLNNYLMTLDKEEQQRVLTKHSIKRPTAVGRKVKLVKKHPGEPKMPPRSGNAIFCKHQMELLKEKFPNSRERFVKASQLWLELSSEKKARYKEKVHESIRKYSMELQKWFKTLSSAEQKKYLTSNPSKCQYLDVQKTKVDQREELALYRPSDSEDEDIEESGSEEEGDDLVYVKDDEEEEEEEQGDDIMFELF